MVWLLLLAQQMQKNPVKLDVEALLDEGVFTPKQSRPLALHDHSTVTDQHGCKTAQS